MSFLENIKNRPQGGLDLRDVLFLVCVAIAIYGVHSMFGLGAACIAGGAAGMWLTYASTPVPEEPEPEPPAAPEGQQRR